MASDYPWQNLWPLVYGSTFSSSVLTSSLQYYSYYRMYFYNKLTITCNLCHEALCHDLFRDSPIITSNATKTTLHCALANDRYSKQIVFCAVGFSTTVNY